MIYPQILCSRMELAELTINQRVRVPATDRDRGGYHYARVRDIVEGLLDSDPVVIIEIPALKEERAVSPQLLLPERKTSQTSK